MAERFTRTTVVERAAVLSDEIGLDDVTITKLGRALGIAPPGVYRHVSDLADLRRALSREAAHEVAAALSTACAGLAGADALTALADTLRAWAAQHPGRYAALQVAPDPADADGRAAAEVVVAVIASVLRAYRITGDDLTDAIRMIRATLHGFIALERGEGFKDPRSLDASFARIVLSLDTVLSGWSS